MASPAPSPGVLSRVPCSPCRCAAENAKIPCVGGHPKNIIMLCCDAFGVLPPVAKLTKEQAMYYFIRCGCLIVAPASVSLHLQAYCRRLPSWSRPCTTSSGGAAFVLKVALASAVQRCCVRGKWLIPLLFLLAAATPPRWRAWSRAPSPCLSSGCGLTAWHPLSDLSCSGYTARVAWAPQPTWHLLCQAPHWHVAVPACAAAPPPGWRANPHRGAGPPMPARVLHSLDIWLVMSCPCLQRLHRQGGWHGAGCD